MGFVAVGSIEPQHKRLYRAGDVLQIEGAKLLKSEVEPALHMITHGPRDADTTRRTFGLKSRRHIYRVPMQISPIGNCIANVDPDAEADGAIRRLISVMDRNLLLHLHGTAHRSVDAVEHDQQEIAPGLDDPAAMLLYRGVYQLAAQRPQSSRGFLRHPTRSGGCSQPYRHRRRRSASADLAASHQGQMRCSPTYG